MTIRRLSYEEELDFFERYERVVYYCLSRLNIRPHQPDFDDLAQIARMELVQVYESFDHPIEAEDFPYRFVAYAKNRIRWRLIDALRRWRRIQQFETAWESHHPACKQAEDQWGELDFLMDLKAYERMLTDQEKTLLTLRFDQGKSMVEIAEELNVSRQSLYRWRAAIIKKLQALMGNCH